MKEYKLFAQADLSEKELDAIKKKYENGEQLTHKEMGEIMKDLIRESIRIEEDYKEYMSEDTTRKK